MANPNPSPETRFGGENGNPSGAGKTSAQRKAEIRSAEISALLREKMLSEMLEKVEAQEGEAIKAIDLLDANTLKLFKDSEDRAHGTPKSTSELSGPNGGAVPVSSVVFEVHDPKQDAD